MLSCFVAKRSFDCVWRVPAAQTPSPPATRARHRRARLAPPAAPTRPPPRPAAPPRRRRPAPLPAAAPAGRNSRISRARAKPPAAPAATPSPAITAPSASTPTRIAPRLRSDRQADAELARAAADRERQHAGHADDRDRERDGGEPAEHDRVQAVRRQHLRAHVVERRRPLDRLIGRQLAHRARDDRHERVRIGARVDEQPAAGQLLLERVIDGHRRRRIDPLVVDVGDDADDAARLRADADELHQAVGPDQVAIDRVLAGKELLGDAGADDHDPLGAVAIGLGEVAAGHERDAERGKESGRHRPEPRPRIVDAVLARAVLRPRTAKPPPGPPRDRATAPCCRPPPARRRARRDAALHLAVEAADLLRRAAVRRDRHVDGQHARRLESGPRRLQRQQRLQQHAGAGQQHERGGDLRDRERAQPPAGRAGDAQAAARQAEPA